MNAAVAAASADASATVVGRVGDDRAGDLVAAALADRGIDARLARDPELPTGTAVAFAADPSSVGVVANRGANARLSPGDLPAVLDADALFVSGFALFQEGSAAAARAALQRFAGSWAGVDLASPKLAAAAALDEVAQGAAVVFATAEEARALTGAGPEEAARALASRFAIACVKLGAEGAIASYDGRLERRAAAPVVRSAPFGAGDAFAAALLVALARGSSPPQALERGCEAGARAASLS